MILSACSAPPKAIDKTVVVESVIVHQKVPSWLTKAVEVPTITGNKYKHLVELAINHESAINQCNIQLDSIKKLSDETKPVNR